MAMIHGSLEELTQEALRLYGRRPNPTPVLIADSEKLTWGLIDVTNASDIAELYFITSAIPVGILNATVATRWQYNPLLTFIEEHILSLIPTIPDRHELLDLYAETTRAESAARTTEDTDDLPR